MIISPYGSLVARGHVLDGVRSQITKAFTLGEVDYLPAEAGQIVLIAGSKDFTTNIPQFAHPIEFEDIYKNLHIAIDVRPCVSNRRRRIDPITVSNRGEFKLLVQRAILQNGWNNRAFDDLRNISTMPIQVFSRWIPEAISQKLGLDPEVQKSLAAMTAFFFICQFIPVTGFLDKDRAKYYAQVSRATRVSYDDVTKILDKVAYMGNLTEFCDEIVRAGLSRRLDSFAPGILIPFVAGSWYGTQSKEMVAIALEHPPTFVAMVNAAINERGYSKTRLGDMIQRSFMKGDDATIFNQNFRRYLEAWRPQ